MDVIGIQALYLRPPAVGLTKEGSRNFTDLIDYGWHWRTGPQSTFSTAVVLTKEGSRNFTYLIDYGWHWRTGPQSSFSTAVVLTKEGSRNFTYLIDYGYHWRTAPLPSYPCCRPDEGRISEQCIHIHVVLAYRSSIFD